jgi:hypothetical protein
MRLPPDNFKQSSNVCGVWQEFITQEIEGNERLRKKRKLLSDSYNMSSKFVMLHPSLFVFYLFLQSSSQRL